MINSNPYEKTPMAQPIFCIWSILVVARTPNVFLIVNHVRLTTVGYKYDVICGVLVHCKAHSGSWYTWCVGAGGQMIAGSTGLSKIDQHRHVIFAQ